MHTGSTIRKARFTVLWLLVAAFLTAACTTTQQTQRSVGPPVDTEYQRVQLVVELAEPADTAALTEQLVRWFSQRGIAITQAVPGAAKPHSPQAGLAILRVDEVDREIVTDRYHRSYPRYPLTANRGWKTADKPVITLRATMMDGMSGTVLFEADYVSEGPWYASSQSVVSGLAATLVQQLADEGFIR
jgi:hypothetical protein